MTAGAAYSRSSSSSSSSSYNQTQSRSVQWAAGLRVVPVDSRILNPNRALSPLCQRTRRPALSSVLGQSDRLPGITNPHAEGVTAGQKSQTGLSHKQSESSHSDFIIHKAKKGSKSPGRINRNRKTAKYDTTEDGETPTPGSTESRGYYI